MSKYIFGFHIKATVPYVGFISYLDYFINNRVLKIYTNIL